MNFQAAEITAAGNTIESVQTEIIDLPFRRLQHFARFKSRVQSSLLIRIRDTDGARGIGEAIVPCGPWWSGDTVEAMKMVIDAYLAPAMIGHDPQNMGPLFTELDRIARNNAFAKAGLEMALLDLVGKSRGVPVWALLGGKYRDHCPVAWPLASGNTQEDISEIEEKLGTGRACAFKIKMGSETLREDVARVKRLSAALGGRAGLRVDPNEAWSEVDALYAMPRLAEAGIELVEQPFHRAQHDLMARITRASGVAIMIDEGAQSEADTMETVKRGAAHIVSLKIMKAGGLLASRRMADIARAGGLSVYLGTFLETSIGTAAGLHLAASCPDLPLGGEVIGPMLLAEDLVVSPIEYDHGSAHLPAGPGLGVELDESVVRRFRRA